MSPTGSGANTKGAPSTKPSLPTGSRRSIYRPTPLPWIWFASKRSWPRGRAWGSGSMSIPSSLSIFVMPSGSGGGSSLRGGNLFDYIDGGAEIFLEFGFDRLLVQDYRKEDSEIGLELFQMESPESALGIYLMKCGAETPIDGVPARNSGDKTQFTILKGATFVHINNPDGRESLLPMMVDLP